jgi:hypothetical protein
MVVRWVDWKCPACGKVVERTLMKKLTLGEEFSICKHCASRYRTRRTEWAHLSSGQRLEYFFTEDIVAILILAPLFGFLASPAFNDRSEFSWTYALWGFAVAATITGIQWYFKVRNIRASIVRCPEERATGLVEESKLPWKRKY